MTRAGIRAGLRFGVLAFLIGPGLGPVWEALLAPRIGGLAAAMLEAAAMLPAPPFLRRRA